MKKEKRKKKKCTTNSDCATSGIGWTCDTSTGTCIAPAPAPAPNCTCFVGSRVDATKNIPNWNTSTVCSTWATNPTLCQNLQKTVCQNNGYCFDAKSGGPWCYTCSTSA